MAIHCGSRYNVLRLFKTGEDLLGFSADYEDTPSYSMTIVAS